VDGVSETANVDLFKSRLAQLKKVLERDAKIAEKLFYAALQLDKNQEFKSGVQEIIEKHKIKVKKGYLYLPDDEKDRPAVVKALLKDSFDFLLKAFNVDKSQLVQRAPSEQKVHALQLFEMQSTLEAQMTAQATAFETTMKDLDKIDTSTPLEQAVVVPPPSEAEATANPALPTLPTPQPPIVPLQPTAISRLAIAEQKPEPGSSSIVKPLAIAPASTTPPIVRKPTPLPPRFQQRGTIQATPVVPIPAEGIVPQQKPVQKPASSLALVPTRKPVPAPPAAAKLTPAPNAALTSEPAHDVPVSPILKPVPSPPVVTPAFPSPLSTVESAPAPVVPVQTSIPVPPPPITYEYYVCNRCGDETSKSVIRQIGAFIECPKCKFTFSRAEATIIHKSAPGSEHVKNTGQEEATKPFELFGGKQPDEDESLIRPSWLFADREKESNLPVTRAPPARAPEGGFTKPSPVPAERLVRPSEYLGLAAGSPPPDQASQDSSPAASSPAPTDTEKVAESPTSEYFVEEQPDLQKMRKVTKKTMAGAPVLATRPIDGSAPASQGDACPRCGSSKYSKIQDRSKVISYNPLIYGSKKKCTMCSFEFD